MPLESPASRTYPVPSSARQRPTLMRRENRRNKSGPQGPDAETTLRIVNLSKRKDHSTSWGLCRFAAKRKLKRPNPGLVWPRTRWPYVTKLPQRKKPIPAAGIRVVYRGARWCYGRRNSAALRGRNREMPCAIRHR